MVSSNIITSWKKQDLQNYSTTSILERYERLSNKVCIKMSYLPKVQKNKLKYEILPPKDAEVVPLQ